MSTRRLHDDAKAGEYETTESGRCARVNGNPRGYRAHADWRFTGLRDGRAATIVIEEEGVLTLGTDGDDVIVGTFGPDQIDGGLGNDTPLGLGLRLRERRGQKR